MVGNSNSKIPLETPVVSGFDKLDYVPLTLLPWQTCADEQSSNPKGIIRMCSRGKYYSDRKDSIVVAGLFLGCKKPFKSAIHF